MTSTPSPVVSQAITEIMEQIFQLAYSVGYAEGLRPSQWAALRYFDQSEASARTVIRYARYNHITKGTASTTIQALVRRGYLERAKAFDDRRSHRIDLTPAGREMLQNDPIAVVVAAVSRLPEDQRAALSDSLRQIFGDVVEATTAAREAAD